MADFIPVYQSDNTPQTSGSETFPSTFGQALDPYAYALSQGVLQMTSLPAEGLSWLAHKALPNAISQYIASPSDIQNFYEKGNALYQQGAATNPGMSLAHFAGNVLSTPMPISGAMGAAGQAAKDVVGPGLMGSLLAGVSRAGLAGGMGATMGALSNQPGLQTPLNYPAAARAGLVGAALGPIQGALTDYLSATPVATQAPTQSFSAGNYVPNFIKINGEAQPIAQAAESPAAQAALNGAVKAANRGWFQNLLDQYGGAGAIGSGIGYILGGPAGAYTGLKLALTAKAAKTILSNQGLRSVLSFVNNLPDKVSPSIADLAGSRLTDALTRVGITASLGVGQDQNPEINLHHDGDFVPVYQNTQASTPQAAPEQPVQFNPVFTQQ